MTTYLIHHASDTFKTPHELSENENAYLAEEEQETLNCRESQALAPQDGDSIPSLSEDPGDNVDESMDEAIEEMELENAETASVVAFGGIENLGNTCYMASSLQMLASIDSFVDALEMREPVSTGEDEHRIRQIFLDIMKQITNGQTVHPEKFKEVIDARSPLFAGFRQQDSHEFLTTLLDLIDEEYKVRNKEETKDADDTPMKESLDEIDQSPSKRARREDDQHQDCVNSETPAIVKETGNDSHVRHYALSELDVDGIGELLYGTSATQQYVAAPSSCLATLEPRFKLAGGRMTPTDVVVTPYEQEGCVKLDNSINAASTSYVEEPPSNSDIASLSSPVDSFFTTEIRVRLTCDSCKYSRSHREKFLHLSLEISPDGSSINEALRQFFAPEKRELKCEKCFYGTATQTSQIVKLPRVLLLHFKRFIVDVMPDYSSVSYKKNRSPVHFDNFLSIDKDAGLLAEFMAVDYMLPDNCSSGKPEGYSIRSVVNHIGSSASCGHYTADANRSYRDGERVWTRFNDSHVSLIKKEDAIYESRETAYMILYELE